jgi:UDP-GlcNAc3NAcA epimerase
MLLDGSISAAPPFKVLTIVGARPQFVKAAAVSRAIAARPDLQEIMVHTGQHFDANMSEVFFTEMSIPRPQHSLDIHGGGHGEMTGRMMIALDGVMQAERPDMVLVYGDTNSTLAGAICAAKLNIPVAHVEAGLRSFDRRMPEEVNRVVTDHVSTLMFCPTDAAARNLQTEGVTQGVSQVGDVMFDSTLILIDAARKFSTIMGEIGVADGNYALATLHRASTTDDPAALKAAIDFLKTRGRDHAVVLPLHPRTKAIAERLGLDMEGLTVIEPVGPIDMHRLLAGCVAVYTDSGGLQKEAYFHRKPCVTLRDTTEWVETIDAGWNRLWCGPDYLSRRDIADYGDGHSAERVAAAIATYLEGSRL